MKIWARLKTFNLLQLFKLAQLFITKPHYIKLTLQASKKAVVLANKHYGNTHQYNNRANAFRHALWVVLLGQFVYQKNEDITIAKNWALKVTTAHEDIAVNKPLERTMDLHNNKVGILLLAELINKKEDEIVLLLKKKAQEAQQICEPEEVVNLDNQLVYISEE
ncbi:DUF6973 domain-containing protein [Leeuwenhoekiella aequorea]|uniref:DUF6973 domain-containing protein n=1 Tax=Leeuwenhoekiella aequorea TaxID=283736 RepID=A0A4Q0PC76_9FLAO|nr:hypothetical protein [Leeuwenhoekiella aequorea]RXG24413.1 hypothetical protein DSM00_201 [Leeuwenhoekiella aequorea]